MDDEVPVGEPLAEMEPGEGAERDGARPRVLPRQGALRLSPPASSPPDVTRGWKRLRRRANGANGGAQDVRATPVARRVAEAKGSTLAR